MTYDSKKTVIDLRQLSLWQRLKGACLLVFKGGFEINGCIHTKVEP